MKEASHPSAIPSPTNRTPRNPEKGRLRALNIPRAINVAESDGKPVSIHTQSGAVEIESIRELWRIDDEWWRRPISRMYYHVLLASGDQLTIYKDLQTGQWFQQQY